MRPRRGPGRPNVADDKYVYDKILIIFDNFSCYCSNFEVEEDQMTHYMAYGSICVTFHLIYV